MTSVLNRFTQEIADSTTQNGQYERVPNGYSSMVLSGYSATTGLSLDIYQTNDTQNDHHTDSLTWSSNSLYHQFDIKANYVKVSVTNNTGGAVTPHLFLHFSNSNTSSVDTSSLATETTLDSVKTAVELLDNTLGTENNPVPPSLSLIGGRYDNSERTLDDGDIGAINLSSDGSVINRSKASSQTFTDGEANSKRVAQDQNGNTLSTQSMNYCYNGSTWDRLRGTIDGLNTVDLIRQKRSEDKCYAITVNGGTHSSTDPDFILWNPSGSGVTLYVYHLSYTYCGTVSSAGQQKIEVELINAFTASGGLALGPAEMLYNTTSNSNQATTYYSGDTTTRWRALHDDYFYCDATKNNFHRDLKLETDILEIHEGYGLQVLQDSADAGMRLNVQCRWYEE